MQEAFGLSPEKWDFGSFYSENPDTDTFLCKVLVAGAVTIYLDIISRIDIQPMSLQPQDSAQRVNQLFNIFLEECSGDKCSDPAAFDPFKNDPALRQIQIDKKLRREYKTRVQQITTVFKKRFKVFNCQEILGFDPFRYAEYDEDMQAFIEEGEWQSKCNECIQFVVKTISGEK
ncbi:MAG: hypothetical protein OET81_10010 [Desulfobacteraceae bacterium]|jgi:hypothetical protein|nr:hypothetical protein [Desulfobacteraceae bacterium]MDH3957018.1 hypothetical protein [Desulfobacteraceae bacterium]